MVPAVPLLFLATVPVMRRMPRGICILLVAASAAISLAVTMTREDVRTALELVFRNGPTLPILIVLRKMESGYSGAALPWFTIWLVYAVAGLGLFLIWRNPRPGRATS
jgi:hypothetical protein